MMIKIYHWNIFKRVSLSNPVSEEKIISSFSYFMIIIVCNRFHLNNQSEYIFFFSICMFVFVCSCITSALLVPTKNLFYYYRRCRHCDCLCVVYALNRQYLFENLIMIITTATYLNVSIKVTEICFFKGGYSHCCVLSWNSKTNLQSSYCQDEIGTRWKGK